MPCPYFEPTKPAETKRHPGARLPLIVEFEGLCHAGIAPLSAPDPERFACCNHGYARPGCLRVPADDKRSCLRYSAGPRNGGVLEVVCIEEIDHAPAEWQLVHYDVESGRVVETLDVCRRAQAEAFARGYLAAARD